MKNKILILFYFIVFGYANSTSYTHSHTISGETFSHSHPILYDKFEHTHSEKKQPSTSYTHDHTTASGKTFSHSHPIADKKFNHIHPDYKLPSQVFNEKVFSNDKNVFSYDDKLKFYINLGTGGFNDTDDDDGFVGQFAVGVSIGINKSFSLAFEFGSYIGEYDEFNWEWDLNYFAIRPELHLTDNFSFYIKVAPSTDFQITDYNLYAIERDYDSSGLVAVGFLVWANEHIGIGLEYASFTGGNGFFKEDLDFDLFTLNLHLRF